MLESSQFIFGLTSEFSISRSRGILSQPHSVLYLAGARTYGNRPRQFPFERQPRPPEPVFSRKYELQNLGARWTVFVRCAGRRARLKIEVFEIARPLMEGNPIKTVALANSPWKWINKRGNFYPIRIFNFKREYDTFPVIIVPVLVSLNWILMHSGTTLFYSSLTELAAQSLYLSFLNTLLTYLLTHLSESIFSLNNKNLWKANFPNKSYSENWLQYLRRT